MSFASLGLLVAIGVLGPALAASRRWRLPTLLGEVAAGFLAGPALLDVVHPDEPTLAFLANVGFALVMFVAGTHVPVRDSRLRRAARLGLLRAVLVGVLAIPAGLLIAATFHTGHGLVYGVVLASSSAALVFPTLDTLMPTERAFVDLVPQVAIADTVCILLLQAVIQTGSPARVVLASGVVIVTSVLLFLVLNWAERSGRRRQLHRLSEQRKFALELRINLAILFGLSAVAIATGASVLLAGFAFGLVVAAVGEPRRLARQLFALTEGFFGPLFFVWLGASLSSPELLRHPSYILMGVVLGVVAIIVHLAPMATGQPPSFGLLAAAQLGVPVAAVALGTEQHILAPGEAAALMIGALVTVAGSTIGAVLVARRGQVLLNRSG